MMEWLLSREWEERIVIAEEMSVRNADIIKPVTVAKKTSDIKNGVATIDINGVLTRNREPYLDFFGISQTSYTEIAEQTKYAVNKGAKHIVYKINSPGGKADGILIGMDAIRNAGVPTEVHAEGMLASGAYMLASQADKIIANDELTLVGSIGVATKASTSNVVKEITNTDSADKRPDVTTKDGLNVVKTQLDDIYQILAERIADGRKTTVQAIKDNYGHGATMSARTALQRHMIDGIKSEFLHRYQSENKPSASQSAETHGEKMDIKELKAENPGLYQEIFELGVTAGSEAEKERVESHLILADGSGDYDTAHEAIKNGDKITEKVKALHMAAAMKRNAIAAKASDNVPPIGGKEPVITEDDKVAKELGAIDGLEWRVM